MERVNEYPLEKVERITWVPREKIREAARLFAPTKPAAIQWGVAIEQQVNCADNDRALMALMGITGNIDAPGGQVLFKPPKIRNVGQFGAHQMLSAEQAAKRLGGDRFRLAGNFAIINPKCVWDAILEEKPYPVKMLFFISSNPLMTRANAREVYRALEKVEFMAVSDFFLTPTAELADIVLPAATWLEMDYIGDFWKRHGYILPRRKVVQIGECRSDHEMLNDLAHRVGQGEHWWDNFEGGLDWILEPTGITWQDFKKMDHIRGEVTYQKYREKGFSTPTRKVRALFHPAGEVGLRSPAPVPGTAGEPRQHAGALPGISLHPDHRPAAAGFFPYREPSAPLAPGTPPGPGGGDPSGDRGKRRHPGGGLGRHRIAPGKGPAAGQALCGHGPEGRVRPACLVVPGKGGPGPRLGRIQHQYPDRQ